MKLKLFEWVFIGGMTTFVICAIVYGIMRDRAKMARMEDEFRAQQEWERQQKKDARKLARIEWTKKRRG
jgi:uncharacterized membrane protein (DUF106 family)